MVKRKCPECQLVMSSLPLGSNEVEFCGTCKGLWFDSKELAEAVDADRGDRSPEMEDFYSTRPSRRQCPCCHISMNEVVLSDLDICVEKCSKCNGLFLDQGEYQKAKDVYNYRRNLKQRLKPKKKQKKEDLKETNQSSEHLNVTGYSTSEVIFQFFTGLPIEIDSRQKAFSPVVTTLILLNVFMYVITLFNPSLIRVLALYPDQIVQGHRLFSLLTSTFIHGGFLHLAFNMYFLFIAGDDVEDVFGSAWFIPFYFLGGLAADGLHIAFFPASNIPTLGASGAISAVLGAYFALYPRKKFLIRWFWFFHKHINFEIPSWVFLGFWFLEQIFGLALGSQGIAWYAHAGGFAAGVAMALIYSYVDRWTDK